jgi:Domain of unknown function (4846)
MKNKICLLFAIGVIACNSPSTKMEASPKDGPVKTVVKTSLINENEMTLGKRFDAPIGFVRSAAAEHSIAHFLRNLQLKKWGSAVQYYDGSIKTKEGVYCSIIDLPIGKQDLHQCADAVMNLWAQFLFSEKRYTDIQFKFLNDDAWHNYAKWSGGNYTSKNFFTYMQQVWSAANTASLFTQTKSIALQEVKIGDILLVKGKPYGHAMMIVDECINEKTGKKLFMLAQSYMPAQETQIVINPNEASISPWYSFDGSTDIITPEWNFTTNDFRRF